MNPKTKIHFVCRGNIFRSKTVEAYLKSLHDDSWDVSSSGIDADKLPGRGLSPWAKSIGQEHGFSQWLNDECVQTTSEILQANDLIVFVAQDVYDDARKRYDFNAAKCLVWHVKDRENWPKSMPKRVRQQRTFKTIQHDVQQLVEDVDNGGWIDIVDDNNQELGFRLPITIANKKGLWHRACHALITTPDRKTLVQKRSGSIIFSPGLIDVTLGGHVDAGENPEQAMVREIREEIGLDIPANAVRLLEVYKWSSYHPRYKRHTNSFMYTYHLPLSENHPIMSLQNEEVSAVKLLSPAALKRLLAYNQLRGLGRLNYAHGYYRRIIALANS